jgi:hypothetical protein
MMKKITLFFVALTAVVASASAQSFTALYAFDSVKTSPGSGLTDPSPVPTATGITFGSFSAVGTPSTNPNAVGRFSFQNWPTGATSGNNTYSALTGALSTSQYYEVTLTPAMGYAVTLSGIAFRVQRSAAGIRTYSVRSSADNYAANLTGAIMPVNPELSVQAGNVFFYNNDTATGQNGSAIALTGGSFTTFTSPLTFRFYGWNAEGTGGTFSIDTVVFAGSVSTTTGITNNATVESAVVYPNPSADGVFSLVTNATSATDVTVHNIIGEVVYSKKALPSSKEVINLSEQPNGSYFLTLKNNSGIVTKKIFISK